MSRFYGTLESERRKQITKGGHRYVEAHVRGWDFGVFTQIKECPHCGADIKE